MPIYHMSLFRMPKSVARRLDKVQRDFLWEGGSEEKKLILSSGRRFVVIEKYGQEGHGWRAKKAYGTIGVGFGRKYGRNLIVLDNMGFIVGKGKKINFGLMFGVKIQGCPKVSPTYMLWLRIGMRTVEEMNLLHVLRNYKPSMEEDSVRWKGGRNVPTKVAFYAWEATWGGCSLLIDFRKEDDSFLIVVFYVGVQWVFPETVKGVLTSWRGPFVGKKRKKIWKFIPLCIFWTVWKERNRIGSRVGSYLGLMNFKFGLVLDRLSTQPNPPNCSPTKRPTGIGGVPVEKLHYYYYISEGRNNHRQGC
ncbi:hypothetical protein CK203_075328 [Vitis vinifera]|uniref:Uncharacterized protein n=1 Tax=Vitis vinifera TaxID=29760 RepID=A0A438BXI5_VITVI|nr:hypothetical protein CK203_075328 [Vitis vinifera]